MTTATAEAPKITLAAWAASQFAEVPHVNTLRKWARTGQIRPKPELVGREYLVLPTARYVRRKK
jgi:hypothetical protein